MLQIEGKKTTQGLDGGVALLPGTQKFTKPLAPALQVGGKGAHTPFLGSSTTTALRYTSERNLNIPGLLLYPNLIFGNLDFCTSIMKNCPKCIDCGTSGCYGSNPHSSISLFTRSSRARHGAPQGSTGDRLGGPCTTNDFPLPTHNY